MHNNRTETNPAITLRLQSGTNWRGVAYPTRSGRVKRFLLMFLFACCLPTFAADKGELLKKARAEVDGIWTNWMGKPKLTYDRISTNKLASICGQWAGSYAEEDKTGAAIDLFL